MYAQTPENISTDPLVSLVVRGELVVEGTAGAPVQFKPTQGSTSAEWAGLLFDLAAADMGYGYGTNSSISYAEIIDATAGITIRQTGAPSLDTVTFTNIVDDRHIVIDSSDVYVPYDSAPFTGGWTLTAPTKVKIARATRSGAEIGDRNPGKVDLIVHGTLTTSGSSSSRVTFEPDGTLPSATSGDEWGGVFLDWMATGCVVDDVDIGYARTPLVLFYQDAVVRDSFLHHFKDRGLWVVGTGFSEGPSVLNTRVERQPAGTASLNTDFGNEGIVIEDCAFGIIEADTVRLTGMLNDTGGSGLRILSNGGKFGFCSQTLPSADTLMVRESVLEGPGGNPSGLDGAWSGLRGDWACGAGVRKVHIEENIIDGWNEAGFKFDQSKDVQVSCNRVENCKQGVEFTRNTDATGPEVRFRENALAILDNGTANDQKVIRTNDAVNARFGPSGATLGLNNIVAEGADWFMFENDEDAADTLKAIDNYWERADSVYTFSTAIRLKCSKDAGVSDAKRVDPTSPESSPSTCAPSAQMARRDVVRLEAQAPSEEGASMTRTLESLPVETKLVLRGPSPSRATVEVRFDLAGPEPRQVVIEVFDVTGRRVRKLIEGEFAGGTYGLAWKGDSESGEVVGAGVYFVRMKAGSFTQVRKALLLR